MTSVPVPARPVPAAAASRPSCRATLVLVAAVVLARLAYLALWCPYTLVEDEAHYWEWSRRLGWSYYSKGPGIAWAIAASTGLFRALGLAADELAVRLPTIVFLAAILLAVSALAREVTKVPRAGLLAAVGVLVAPGFWFGSLLMTIDMPYCACWALAALAAWRAMRCGSRWAWLGLGATIGVGFLFKYTILLLVPGLAAYAWVMARRGGLRLAPAWRGWLLGGTALALLGLAPVLIWNAQHGWVTVKHLLGHLGVAGGDVVVPKNKGWSYNPVWTLSLIGAQIGLAGPLSIVMAAAAARAIRQRHEDAERWSGELFLLLCAAPIFIFYLLVTLMTKPQGNWPLAGYVTLFPLAGAAVARALEARVSWIKAGRPAGAPRPWAPARAAWIASLAVGIAVALLAARLDLIAGSGPMRSGQRLLYRIGILKDDRPLIPMGRLMGARELSLAADRLVADVSTETGQVPFVIAQQYGRASILAFYMPGRPTVYCSSAKSEGRKTQYDMWPQTSLEDPSLLGRPAVLVGGKLEEWTPAFQSVRLFGHLEGETKRDRQTFIGLGYRGFPPPRGGGS